MEVVEESSSVELSAVRLPQSELLEAVDSSLVAELSRGAELSIAVVELSIGVESEVSGTLLFREAVPEGELSSE